ncbi:class I adenylate-forming enzyme family protein [Nocardioides dongkuii]|uniref:class I adenylate-forming enzyme family protein n=1 Tax=Nocardioides dongkuii TaxID=2760089 RepID=UPI0015FCF30D|nr:class I adenylate-forming enzyme family protein [Nocardioides dongkuii]
MKTDPAVAEDYRRQGWWSTRTVGELVRGLAGTRPDAIAYVDDHRRWSWRDYDATADRIAAFLTGLGVGPGERVAVHLPDGGLLHATYTACERAGVIAVGVPARAGDKEVAQLLVRTGARVILMPPELRGRPGREVVAAVLAQQAELDVAVEVQVDGHAQAYRWSTGRTGQQGEPVEVVPETDPARALGPEDVWLLNSTSGTTGLPKAVMQTQNRWFYLARAAADGARVTGEDVVLSAIPGPYGFGLWTAHMLPAMLGARCCLTERFSPDDTLRMIERERVTVLACVTTQLVMMMRSPLFGLLDLSSLRAVFTGGERVPTEKADLWERSTGSTVLQFYGSNEAGPFSCTRLDDDRDTRLTTAGRVLDGVVWQLLDRTDEEVEVGGSGVIARGQATLKSPGAHGGYWEDPAANQELYTDDGFLVLPDVVTIDPDDRVCVVGRKSDFIIRGGKNISASVVEEEVTAHPAVHLAVAVAVPDETFGERVGVAVALEDAASSLTLDQVVRFLRDRGVSMEYLPEHLLVLEEIPMSLGAKADKRRIKTLFEEAQPHAAR